MDDSCTCAQVTADDKLFLFRPTSISRADYQPLPEPVHADTGGWQLADFFASQSSLDGGDELTVTVDPPASRRHARAPRG